MAGFDDFKDIDPKDAADAAMKAKAAHDLAKGIGSLDVPLEDSNPLAGKIPEVPKAPEIPTPPNVPDGIGSLGVPLEDSNPLAGKVPGAPEMPIDPYAEPAPPAAESPTEETPEEEEPEEEEEPVEEESGEEESSSASSGRQGLIANEARFSFVMPSYEDAGFHVVDFVGEEEISRPFRFELNLVSKESALDYKNIVAMPGRLTTRREGEDPVFINGMVADFQETGYTSDWFGYKVVLVPCIWQLSLNYRSRVFQNMTVEEIVQEVLFDAIYAGKNYDYRFEVKNPQANPKREYCVQYRETDLDFLHRLLEQYGIRYHFEYVEYREVMVMVDIPEEELKKKMAIPGQGNTIEYNEGGGLMPLGESVREFVYRTRIVPNQFVLKDYNYRDPAQPLESKAADEEAHIAFGGLHYEYGQHYQDQEHGDYLAQVRLEELGCQRQVMYGVSDCGGMRSGHFFYLEGCTHRNQLDGEYLITRVKHFGTQGAALQGLTDMGDPEYRNEFVCIPADIVYRPPRRTPVPQISGIMSAWTETASDSDDYAFLDEEGRYRARMLFDLGDAENGQASRPIRMNQPYSGSNYGIHFPNHAGTEMVWACVDGNPDRPIALGTVPNGEGETRFQTSPVTSENKTQNIIRTFAGNQILMEDLEGSTKIEMSTPGGHTGALDDGEKVIHLTSTGEHKLRLDDENKYISLQSATGNRLMLNDEGAAPGDTGAALISSTGHSLSLTDQEGENQGAELVTVGNHVLNLNDNQKSVALKSSDGHGLLIKDESDEAAFSLADSHSITLNAEKGITIMSKKDGFFTAKEGKVDVIAKKITMAATEELVLTVGASSITIKKDTVTISAPKVYSTAMGNQTISGALIKIN